MVGLFRVWFVFGYARMCKSLAATSRATYCTLASVLLFSPVTALALATVAVSRMDKSEDYTDDPVIPKVIL